METKKLFSEKNQYQGNYPKGKAINGYLYSPELPEKLNGEGRDIGRFTALQLHELEKRNAKLEKLAKQRKTEMDEINARNRKYILILAHDLKTPFSSIYGVLGILKELIYENKFDEMEEYIDIASSSALNTNNLIDNHLAWVIAENKETNFNPVKINLERLVKKEIENCCLSVRLKKITLSHSIEPNLNVLADIQMLKTILRNLINNAIKFTLSGGNISISARKIESLIEITIKDDGIGISSADQQELFRKRSIHSTSVTNNGKGKGLGLLLCKEFINVHGGEIRAESQPGKGSSFIFTLPIHD
ncbi:MAG: sensor histidine kinase [Bacteroidetes bacterium]|nr:MAG: sensor histidine kinase [Bacteroidota bacterium]